VNVPLTVTGVAAVTYNDNGSTSGVVPTDSQGYLPGATVTVLDNSGTLAKTGYVFNGWNTAADGSGTSYQPGATFSYAAPVTLYAKWSVPTAPPGGLVSWWRGEGTAIDTQGRNNGTLQGGATYVPGLVGQAFNFEGSTAQYVSVPSSSSLNIYGTHSVSFWVKLTTLPPAGKKYQVVSKWTNAAEHKQININADGKVYYYLHGTTAGSGVTTTAALQTGVWTHVAATYDGANMKIYINGALNAGVSANNDVWDSSGTLYLGNNPEIAASYSGANFNGQLDELGWFNSALSATDIASIYNAGSAGWALMPTITAITPTSGPASGGTTVTITGSNLTGATAVRFGSAAATNVTVNSDTRITATTPAMAAGTVDVTVTTAGGTSATSSGDQFTYAKVDQSITFDTAPTIRIAGKGAVSATVSSGLAVSLSTQTPSVCTVSGAMVTGIAEGTCTIVADQAGDSIYNPAPQQTQSFTIGAAIAPTVTTTAATAITRNGAILTATVNANYSSAVVSFEYGTTIAYGSTATAIPSPVSGGTPTAIAATISGLAPGSTYHFRVKAENATTGTVYGEDLTFTTALTRFVDLNDGTMLDTTNSLRWLKNANCFGLQNWDTAISSASALASPACGLTDGSAAGDWHLPTIDELQTLVVAPDSYRYDTLATAGFVNVQDHVYWSSSTNADYTEYAWSVYMGSGSVYGLTKVNGYYVWPVRAGQYWQVGSLVVLGNGGFSALPAGSVSSSHQITLKNAGSDDLPVTSLALSGADPGQFSVVEGGSFPCVSLSPTLAAGASCTVLVTATPTSGGSKSANLTFTTTAGSTSVPLSATASYSVPTVTRISPPAALPPAAPLSPSPAANLTGATAVNFDTTAATGFTVNSDTQVTATSPRRSWSARPWISPSPHRGAPAPPAAQDQFSYILQYQAKNQSTTTSYTTLAEAVSSASAGHEIRAYGGQFDGAFSALSEISS
jgi:uncharacterized repeat protein (TIGR02543 family)